MTKKNKDGGAFNICLISGKDNSTNKLRTDNSDIAKTKVAYLTA